VVGAEEHDVFLFFRSAHGRQSGVTAEEIVEPSSTDHLFVSADICRLLRIITKEVKGENLGDGRVRVLLVNLGEEQ